MIAFIFKRKSTTCVPYLQKSIYIYTYICEIRFFSVKINKRLKCKMYDLKTCVYTSQMSIECDLFLMNLRNETFFYVDCIKVIPFNQEE